MSIVSDTSPLVALAKVDALPLVQALYGEALIAPAVYRELLAKAGPETPRLQAALQSFIRVTTVPPAQASLTALISHLDEGEREAITLASAMNLLLLVDEREARAVASILGMSFTGTVGVILQAKRVGLIPQVRALLEALKQSGYYLSDRLIQYALNTAGE